MNNRKWMCRCGVALGAAAVLLTAGGCAVAALAGGMAESYRRTGHTAIAAEYTGLEGKTFAVIATTSRAVETEHIGLLPEIVTRIDERLADPVNRVGAAGHRPAQQMISLMYNYPQWKAMSRQDLAEQLDVDMLIVVELYEFRLQELGNRYVYDGLATGSVEVIERGSALGEVPVFSREVAVRFPDQTGVSVFEMNERLVASVLLKRFIDRASWVFYEHDEPNEIEY